MTNLITATDRWLGKEVHGWWVVLVCLLGISIIILSTLSALIALVYADHQLSPNPSVHTFTTPQNKTTTPTNTTQAHDDTNMNTVDMLSLQFAGLLMYYAFREEILFRLIPFTLILAVVTYAIRNENVPLRLMMLLVISAIFGYIHGGLDHLFVQGVSGMVFGVVYMKCGGVNYTSNIHVYRGLLCSTVVHYSVNMIFSMLTVFLYGMRYFGVP